MSNDSQHGFISFGATTSAPLDLKALQPETMRQFAMFSMTFQMAHHVLHYAAVEILAPHLDKIYMEGDRKAEETGNGQYVDESVAKGKQLIRFYGRKKLIEL